jgi:F-type H+-transporting ATPase subunit b
MGGPFLRSRSAEIRQGIVDAQQVKADAERRAGEIEAKIANLGKEIEQMRAGSRQEMESENQRLKAETANELAKIQARAQMEIASAAKHATQDLKAYSAQLALQLAEEQLKARITPQVQDSLVHNFARELGGKAAHN